MTITASVNISQVHRPFTDPDNYGRAACSHMENRVYWAGTFVFSGSVLEEIFRENSL